VSPDALRRKIEGEIDGNWHLTNLHGVDLRRCLRRRPERQSYRNSFYKPDMPESENNRQAIDLWCVLEEAPETKKGYVIVYDDTKDLFGLAVGDVFIAHYGTFLRTFEAM
jgi:hypothetical protein